MGCPVIIADGPKGIEYREIPLDLRHCKTAKIGSAIADADIIISLNHFKGHEQTGFGGAIKNLGMGSGSRAASWRCTPAQNRVWREKTVRLAAYAWKTAHSRLFPLNEQEQAEIDEELCIGCGQCVALCRFDAAQVVWDQSAEVTAEKIAEYALAVVRGKPNFHINIIASVSPYCDCWSHNDAPIVPDLGIAVSYDPVALDKASVDMVNQAPALTASMLADKGCKPGDDKFTLIHPNTNWLKGLEYAQLIGLGSMDYQLLIES